MTARLSHFVAGILFLGCTQAAHASDPEVIIAASQDFSVDAFLKELKEQSAEAIDARTARFEEIERNIDNLEFIEFECIFKSRQQSKNFKILLDEINEERGFGTSLLWTAKATYQGDMPDNLGLREEVSYGGPPEDIYVWFRTSDLRLHSVNGGMAAEFADGLIKCSILRGRRYLY